MNQPAKYMSLTWLLGTMALVPAAARAQDAPATQLQPAPSTPQPNVPTDANMQTSGSSSPSTNPPPNAPPVAAVPRIAPAEVMPPPATVATAEATSAAVKEPEKPKAVNIGVWLRTALRLQNPTQPKKLNDQSLNYYAELHIGGAIYDKVNYTLNFNVQNQPNDYPGTVHVMDAIAQLDAVDEFHLWAGQMLVASDRSNFSGPFFTSPWNYPGVYSVGTRSAFVGPAEGPAGRNTGATIWGDIGGGVFKYYAGVFNLTDATQSPLFTGRLNVTAIGKEPGFYHSSTYYGDKDILALGVGAQFQKHGSVGAVPVDTTGTPTGPAPVDDFAEFNADLLAEFKVVDSVITGEAAYYHFGGNYNPADNAAFVLVSFLTPKVGVGNIQPLVRYQWAKEKATDTKMSIVDAHLAYVVKEYSLRALVGFQHTDMDHGVVGNAVQVGAQLMTL